ncbi:hypothetical protein F53441_7516 [Fusarium austroafricanum]|uniref:Uncharacterized protein n=1 Tax=Fusarium austroafricanum TaxID=2364996 RepID=A0A8H4KFB1_9HYPO|nr:hypothetical protein F53441_7516 [Fusarium austroafricanum]
MSGTDRVPSPPDAATAASFQRPDLELSHDQAAAAGENEAIEAPMPPFEPLFTLLTNSTTNTTVHPRIHYLFSDDDPSMLATSVEDPSHRALVVDLAPARGGDSSRWAVSWAASLTPDFAVTNSSVAVQQSEGDENGGSGALMLRVEGVEREPVEMRPDSLPSSGSGAIGGEDVDVLAEDFRRRMGVLKKVVDEGEKRRAVVGQYEGIQHAEEDEGAPDEAVVDYDENKDKGKGKARTEDD